MPPKHVRLLTFWYAMSVELTRQKYARKNILLWVLDFVSLTVISIFILVPNLSGSLKIDGGIGVMMGLYICSHPSAHFLDMLLSGRGPWPQSTSKKEIISWISHNVLVLILGWIVILCGTMRFTTK
jgi:hypothetical protein